MTRLTALGMGLLMGAAGSGLSQGLSGRVASVTAPAVCRTIVPDATDGPVASPENHTILYEDADARVIDVHSRPHTQEAVHTHARPAVMYFESSGAGTYNTPDGRGNASHSTNPDFKPTARAIKPEGPHWTENTGEVPFHAIRVEIKHPGCGLAGWKAAEPGRDDALAAASQSDTLLMENDDVRVLDVHLAAGAKGVFHTHLWPSVIYVVQATSMKVFTRGKSDPELRTFPAGLKILREEAHEQAVENASDVPLHLILFELKYGTALASGRFAAPY